MAVEFGSGSLVYQWYGDESVELVAQFQYSSMADDFCRMPRDKDCPAYLRVCTYSGRAKLFPPLPESEPEP